MSAVGRLGCPAVHLRRRGTHRPGRGSTEPDAQHVPCRGSRHGTCVRLSGGDALALRVEGMRPGLGALADAVMVAHSVVVVR